MPASVRKLTRYRPDAASLRNRDRKRRLLAGLELREVEHRPPARQERALLVEGERHCDESLDRRRVGRVAHEPRDDERVALALMAQRDQLERPRRGLGGLRRRRRRAGSSRYTDVSARPTIGDADGGRDAGRRIARLARGGRSSRLPNDDRPFAAWYGRRSVGVERDGGLAVPTRGARLDGSRVLRGLRDGHLRLEQLRERRGARLRPIALFARQLQDVDAAAPRRAPATRASRQRAPRS